MPPSEPLRQVTFEDTLYWPESLKSKEVVVTLTRAKDNDSKTYTITIPSLRGAFDLLYKWQQLTPGVANNRAYAELVAAAEAVESYLSEKPRGKGDLSPNRSPSYSTLMHGAAMIYRHGNGSDKIKYEVQIE